MSDAEDDVEIEACGSVWSCWRALVMDFVCIVVGLTILVYFPGSPGYTSCLRVFRYEKSSIGVVLLLFDRWERISMGWLYQAHIRLGRVMDASDTSK